MAHAGGRGGPGRLCAGQLHSPCSHCSPCPLGGHIGPSRGTGPYRISGHNGGLFAISHAVAHSSEPNYLALFGLYTEMR